MVSNKNQDTAKINGSNQVDENVDQQAVFNIEKLYVKEVSLEVPHAPEIFLAQGNPDVEMKIAIANKKVDEGFYDCTVTTTVTATMEDKRVMFLSEVSQSGIFRMQNIPEEDLEILLNVSCPNILYPYAREVISDLTTRAGFPPVILSPINFDVMYQQKLESEQQA